MTTVVHDWTHYNRWVDMMVDKVGRAKPAPRLPTDWWTIAKAVALSVLALGIAVALMLWSWREPKVVVPDVKVEVQQPQALPWQREREVQKEVADTDKIIRNYVIFTERSVTGIGSVVTGWKYADENHTKPEEQWCYLSPLYGGDAGVLTRIDLPRYSRATAPRGVLVNHRLNESDLERARQSCVWFAGA